MNFNELNIILNFEIHIDTYLMLEKKLEKSEI